MLFPAADGEKGLERALDGLCRRASLAIKSGYTLLILSDRGVDEDYAPIPSLLALAAVHNHLVREGTPHAGGAGRRIRRAARGDALRAADRLRRERRQSVPGDRDAGGSSPRGYLPESVPFEKALKNYIKSVNKGLLKVALEDGDLDAAELSRRAGLRSDRPEQIADRQVFHRHRVAHRRRRAGRAGARGPDEARSRLPADHRTPIPSWPSAATISIACAASITCSIR